jgi:hypothetical protein
MENILKAFEEIKENPDLQQELAKKETIEEVYEYCVSISDGYTFEEFKKYVCELFEVVGKLPEKQLNCISGGIKLNNKALSAALAALTMASPLAGAADNESTGNQQPSVVTSVSKAVQEAKELVLEHPGETALGAAGAFGAVLTAVILGHNHNQGKPEQKVEEQEVEEQGGQEQEVETEQARLARETQERIAREAAEQARIVREATTGLKNMIAEGVITQAEYDNLASKKWARLVIRRREAIKQGQWTYGEGFVGKIWGAATGRIIYNDPGLRLRYYASDFKK